MENENIINESRISEAITQLHEAAMKVPGITVWEYEPQYYTDGSGALRYGNKKSTCAMPAAWLANCDNINEEVRMHMLTAPQRRKEKAMAKVRSRDDFARYLVEFEGESVAEANMMAMRAGRELQTAIRLAKLGLIYDRELREVFIPLYEAVIGRATLEQLPYMQRYYSGYYN